MQSTYDFHTHTTYSHGKGSIMDNAVAAKEKGILGIAITDHGFSHPAFGMKRKKLEKMRQECTEAEKQTGVKVFLGIESNIRGQSGVCDVLPADYEKLDVFCAGIHRFVFFEKFYDYVRMLGDTVFCTTFKVKPAKSLIDYTTRLYVNAIKNNPIDIITHLNYLAFCDVKEVAKACADYGTYIELSTKKVHLTDDEWGQVLSTDAKLFVNSDAHTPGRIGDMGLCNELIQRIPEIKDRIVNVTQEQPIMRFAEFKKKL